MTGGDGGGGGGAGAAGQRRAAATSGGSVEETEAAKRGRLQRIEEAERLKLGKPAQALQRSGGWKRAHSGDGGGGGSAGGGGGGGGFPQHLKDEMRALSGTIRDLTRAHGKEAPETQAAIRRMNEIRAQIPSAPPPTKRVSKREVQAAPTAAEQQRRPVDTACATPLFLRSACTERSGTLRLRAGCGCPATLSLLDLVVAHGDAASALPGARAILREAAAAAAGGCCAVCVWNAATLLLVSGGAGGAEEVAAAAAAAASVAGGGGAGAGSGEVAARMLLLRGMAAEVCGGGGGGGGEEVPVALYASAVATCPSLAAAYFGLTEASNLDEAAQYHATSLRFAVFKDYRIGDVPCAGGAPGAVAGDVQRKAVLKLLERIEFGKVPLAVYPRDCPSAQMQADLHCCVRHFLPPDVCGLLAAHYDEMIDAGVVTFGDRRTERYFAYNDPVARLLMSQYTAYIARVVGHPVKPSYSYMISYRDESELTPHQDREQAEIVVSIQLRMFPECDVWPLWIGAEPQEPKRGDAELPAQHLRRSHVLYNGDAVVFRGRRMIHWREKMAPGTRSTMLLIHYVHADYKGPLKVGLKE